MLAYSARRLVYELEPDRVAVILHIAAETHVDNSIDSPVPFVENNIKSTLTMLEFARTLPQLTHFVYFSTDEVYGSAEEGQAFKEPGRPRCWTPPQRVRRSALRRGRVFGCFAVSCVDVWSVLSHTSNKLDSPSLPPCCRRRGTRTSRPTRTRPPSRRPR